GPGRRTAAAGKSRPPSAPSGCSPCRRRATRGRIPLDRTRPRATWIESFHAAASPWALTTARVLRGALLVDKLDDRRHQFGRNHHEGLILVAQGGFDFRHFFVVG